VSINANGTVVEAVSVGGGLAHRSDGLPPASWRACVLSRWASRHGTAFAKRVVAFSSSCVGLPFCETFLSTGSISKSENCPGGGKCRYKLIAYTIRVVCSTIKFWICQVIPNEGLRWNFESLQMS